MPQLFVAPCNHHYHDYESKVLRCLLEDFEIVERAKEI